MLCDGEPVTLQSMDFDLLCYFMKNQGRILTREQILLKLWGFDYSGSDRSVDTHVKKILEAHYPGGFPHERYKGYAGILQQYMFYHDLNAAA